ncbi:MAG: GNAT family N-acetyltransferase [Oscillochloridaceae bacterium]|nr:GNAT family N-acetyltransferase [Chloroflexaceae bacterium]MDW8392083.1 GNAT family N-acetyltransferase [Oscillochloridaceae bacterium]
MHIVLTYRPLTEQDLDQFIALEQYAFPANYASYVSTEVAADRLERLRGVFAGDALAAQLEVIPLRVQAGAGDVPAAGIGAVASAPQARRQGHVALLLRHLADELRAGGVPLAILYPFKPSFYRRYGWAIFFERRMYSGPPERFASFRAAPGAWERAGAEQIEEFDRIYRGALRGRFGPIARDAAWWRDRVLHAHGRPRQAYIWRDEQGQGRSYLIYHLRNDDDGRRMEFRELVALDPTARAQLFHFIAGHQDQVQRVRFRAPADAPVNLLFPDPLECSVEPDFMLRLLDVPAALEAYPFAPGASGRLTLAVHDDWIAENAAVFALEFAAGRCQATRLPVGAPADLCCEVGTLAQIYSRYLRPRTAAAFGVLEARRREALDLAEQAFAGLAPFSSDFF